MVTLSIRDVHRATPRASIVRLELGDEPLDYLPGQAVTIGTHGGTQRRTYSIASAPEDASRDSCIELLVGVDASGVPGPHLRLEVGAEIDVEGPVGAFTLPTGWDRVRLQFIAGGTGIAPVRAMLRHAVRHRHPNVSVLYSARTPHDFAFEAELQALARSRTIHLHQTITRHTSAQWYGDRGRVDPAILAELVRAGPAMYFICGPGLLVVDVCDGLDALGVPAAHIRTEARPVPAVAAH